MKNTIQKKTILSAVLGNVFEAYDIANFLFLAPFIAQNFFAPGDYQSRLFKTLGIFLIGFLTRPLGGVALGLVADIYGRKKSLVLSILLASVSTASIVLIPGYATIGPLATGLLICARLGQSFALGGEYVTSVAFLIEHAPPQSKGFAGSWAAVGANVGVLIACIIGAGASYLITYQGWPLWTWRIPFLFSLVGVLVSYWVRKNALESLGFVLENSLTEERTPKKIWLAMKQFIIADKKSVLIIFGLTWLVASSYYIVFTYGPLHLTRVNGLSTLQGLLVAMLSVIILAVLAPFAGKLSDKIGRDKVLLYSATGFLFLAYPYFYILTLPNLPLIICMQCLIAMPAAGLYSIILTFIVEHIPLKMRCSLGSFLYSIASSLFGGTAPLIAEGLINLTHNFLTPAYYLIFCALLGVTALLTERPNGQDLRC